MIKTTDLFDLKHTLAADYLIKYEYPWQALKGIKEFVTNLGKTLDPNEYKEIKENVWVHKTVTYADSVLFTGPCIIGKNTELRHSAFIRGSVLIGENCVIGNSVELKNAIIFDNAQVPHFNYVGDSILGYKAHMGAGSITSNLKSDKKNITIHADKDIDTGLNKIGAMIGDESEIGCNSVLNPGTIVGKNCIIYPCLSVRGVIEDNTIYKNSDEQVRRK